MAAALRLELRGAARREQLTAQRAELRLDLHQPSDDPTGGHEGEDGDGRLLDDRDQHANRGRLEARRREVEGDDAVVDVQCDQVELKARSIPSRVGRRPTKRRWSLTAFCSARMASMCASGVSSTNE